MQEKTSLTIQQFLADPKRKQRFTAILGMLGSSAAGEAANAAARATAMLRDADLTWADLVNSVDETPFDTGRAYRKTSHKTPSFRQKLNKILDEIEDGMELNEWEMGFLKSLRRRSSLTEKQYSKLETLAEVAGVEFDLERS